MGKFVPDSFIKRYYRKSKKLIAALSTNKPLKNVFEAADVSQKKAKKRSSCLINKHSKTVFNATAEAQIVFQRPAKAN